MKRPVMIALIIMAWAGASVPAVSVETALNTPGPDPSAVEADDPATPVRNMPAKVRVQDKDVADRLEILQFMDMLEHYDLIKDLDVIEGGGK